MRRVSAGVYAEMYLVGCNHGFVVTEDGVVLFDAPERPIDAMRWRERLLEHGPLRHVVLTEPHEDHVRGLAYFPGVEVVAADGFAARYAADMVIFASERSIERVKRNDPDSEWLMGHPAYPPNPPARTFTDEITLQVGGHTIRCSNLGGHTAEQTHIHLVDEQVLFVGDNIFHQTKTFLHEGDPWAWLAALNWIERLNVDVIVPGHGEPCDAGYVVEQRDIIQRWLDTVQGFVDRGLSEREALAEPLDTYAIDPWPLPQRAFQAVDRDLIDRVNLVNVYRRIRARATGQTLEGRPADDFIAQELARHHRGAAS